MELVIKSGHGKARHGQATPGLVWLGKGRKGKATRGFMKVVEAILKNTSSTNMIVFWCNGQNVHRFTVIPDQTVSLNELVRRTIIEMKEFKFSFFIDPVRVSPLYNWEEIPWFFESIVKLESIVRRNSWPLSPVI